MGFPVDGNAFHCEPTEEEEEERGRKGKGGVRGGKGKKEGRISQSNFYKARQLSVLKPATALLRRGFLSIFNVLLLGHDKDTTRVPKKRNDKSNMQSIENKNKI